MICAVCNSTHPEGAEHCHTCHWYLGSTDFEQYNIELAKARQHWKMISAMSHLSQQIQGQSDQIQQLTDRLSALEVKPNIPWEGDPALRVEVAEEGFPDLLPIAKSDSFDTPNKRLEWWNNLESQWQKVFSQAVFEHYEEGKDPKDEELINVFSMPVLRVVGLRGEHHNIDFELTNLSGIKHLTNLQTLIITFTPLTSLDGIQYLENLEVLFANNNLLTSITELHYLSHLKECYCNTNRIEDIKAVSALEQLETLYCNDNDLYSLEGIVPSHADKIKNLYCLPNDRIKPKDIRRVEDMGIFCRRA